MTLPSTQELKDVIVDILTRAHDDGRLSQLSVRIVRQELTTRFDIEGGVLDGGEYKSFIRDTVRATVNTLENASEGDGDLPSTNPATKEKSSGTTRPRTRKHKSKAQVHPSDEIRPREMKASESESPSSKKSSARSKPFKPVESSKTSKKPESEMKYKSKAVIESSDEEAPRSPKKARMSAKPPSLKKKQVTKEESDVEMDTGEGPGPSSPSSKPKYAAESPKRSIAKAKESTRDPMESELSSVIDEPPKKRQKKQEKESVKPPKGEKIKRGKKEVVSKDEETINKLKGIVVACGVRKVWKKEFEGLDKPSQQIKRLQSILGDLGMKPRYSAEKAKAIRERRELAQELQDVQEFDKATKRRGRGVRSSSEIGVSVDQDESDAAVPARKKPNARTSIMAFLQDQSEEE